MPRKLLFFFFFGLGTLTASSQEFKAGWVAGVTATQVDGDNMSGYNKLGPHLGIYVERYFGPRFSLRPEFLYTIKGAKQYLFPDSAVTPLKASFHYIEVPLMMTWSIKKWKVEAGPSFGVLMRSVMRDQYGKAVNTSLYDRLEWAAHLGTSYSISKRLSAYGRFSYSLDCVGGPSCGSLFVSAKRRTGYFHNVITVGLRGQFGQ